MHLRGVDVNSKRVCPQQWTTDLGKQPRRYFVGAFPSTYSNLGICIKIRKGVDDGFWRCIVTPVRRSFCCQRCLYVMCRRLLVEIHTSKTESGEPDIGAA